MALCFTALAPGTAELAAVRTRANAGDVAAMVRLAVDYYAIAVPEAEALDKVGPGMLAQLHGCLGK